MGSRLLLHVLVGVAACSRDAPRELRLDVTAPIRVEITSCAGSAAVTVEVANTPEQIKIGLMHRTELPAEHGMLFLMKREKDWSFWMQNTKIPLDIIFITSGLTVAGVVHRAKPSSAEILRVGAPSLYVLEVNGGWAEQHAIAKGASVRFENLKL